ncbi:NAD-dependent epimerase/dehydratase family protein [Streptomyces sp. DSM 44915]|uniref:NAD-dependent epimerase/dehydratase family protein n=1 Tax=Streptomyces chisholmiae TaxID=3075540 RepID=A0ABU2K006_9ACTN|nr:NAD-dependent epimerase/dehydratase family protein [Streptomyces sp. DSM 44915]MDT0270343.1 NAD-dependent epimerase/dehydratase family protein [Streptomyces sp. DSM 44915]
MGRTVLVTGAAAGLGARFVRQLRRDPSVGRLIAVDSRLPGSQPPGVEFVRTDLRRPTLVSVLAEHAVDTVVHLDVRQGSDVPTEGRSAVKERNVLGTLQLLGACQRIPGLRRLVVRSSTQVYGGAAREPAVFGEDSPPRAPAGGGFAQDVAEIEGYARGFARRRPAVAVTVLRFAHLLGPGADSALAAYFRLPVLPTVFGYDPRLQLVHEDDALAVLGRAAAEPGLGAAGLGVFNVAGDGVLTLAQAARRLGRPTVPVWSAAAPWLGSALRTVGVSGLSAEQFGALLGGRVARTRRLCEALGGPLPHTTAETFADFVAAHGTGPLAPDRLARVVDRIEEAVRRG